MREGEGKERGETRQKGERDGWERGDDRRGAESRSEGTGETKEKKM